MDKIQIDDMIREIMDAEQSMPFAITYSGQSIELMQSDDCLEHFSLLAGCYYWIPSVVQPATVAGFVSLFNRWCDRNADNIGRQIAALAETYNPIHNYDVVETAADGTRRSKDTVTTTPSGTMQVSSAHTGTDTTTDKRYGFDSSAAVPADTSDLQHGETVTDTTSFTNYKTVTDTESANNQSITLPDGTTGTGYDTGSEHYLHREGNIGVQTAADILGGELAIRVHDIAIEWLERFRDQYFVYWG